MPTPPFSDYIYNYSYSYDKLARSEKQVTVKKIGFDILETPIEKQGIICENTLDIRTIL
jgi:hypothetical protein